MIIKNRMNRFNIGEFKVGWVYKGIKIDTDCLVLVDLWKFSRLGFSDLICIEPHIDITFLEHYWDLHQGAFLERPANLIHCSGRPFEEWLKEIENE